MQENILDSALVYKGLVQAQQFGLSSWSGVLCGTGDRNLALVGDFVQNAM